MNKSKLIYISSFLAIITIVFHVYAKKQPTGDESTMFDSFSKPLQWQGRLAPDFEVTLLSGEKFKLADNIGKKIIILNFFATWCGPCKEEMPELNNYYEKHKNESLILIGIDANEGEDAVRDFVKEFGVTFPVGIDHDGRLQKLYTVRGFPTTVFIGADGTVNIYEIGPIRNADIAFEGFYKIGAEAIKTGKGIEKDAYLRNLQEQEKSKPLKTEDKKEKDKYKLSDRAKGIADKMDCPCGCSDKVIKCECKTAKDIKKRLEAQDISGKTDVDIIKELNKEFCVKDDKG